MATEVQQQPQTLPDPQSAPAQQQQQPIDPSAAQGAQIPLTDFNIPSFPPEARGLQALTLTSDLKVDEYQEILQRPWTIPTTIPTSIESLTLELFSMGYPKGFLSTLADRLPNLKSLVIYSQLFAGITPETQQDAIEFFKKSRNLRALHLLDVFAKPHFFERAAKWLKYNDGSEDESHARRGLMFLEVNYTFRHEDEDFMGKIQATELPLLIGPGLISCSFNLAEPEHVSKEEDEQDPTVIAGAADKEGIMAFNKTLANELIDALTEGEQVPRGLRALNTTLYTLTPEQIRKVLDKQKGLMVMSLTAEIEPGEETKKDLLNAMELCKDLEQVEIVANPSLRFFMEVQNPRKQTLAKTFPDVFDMNRLSEKLPKLSSFKANVLRTKTLGEIEWEKVESKWKGGVKEGKGLPAGMVPAP